MLSLLSLCLISCCYGWGPSDIRYVHVVTSNHFDAGYTNFTANVLNEYFDSYFPEIGEITTKLNQQNISFKFMEHAWIISLYMNCPPHASLHCPSDTQRQTFINLVNKNVITWYAFPFNSEGELYDRSMVEFGAYLAMKQLPSLFTTPHIPRVISQRDVPGMTRSMIPIFKKSNISAISIGANTRAAPLKVPNIFIWQDPVSELEILTIYHPGGYGGIDIKSTVIIDGFEHALSTFWNDDNAGPPNEEYIIGNLSQIQNEFPNAIVKMDTFESFVDLVLNNQTIYNSLSVINKEMGDIWVYGTPSDPLKLSQFRAIQRLRTKCIEDNKCDIKSDSFFNFSRFLIKNGEHTFGGKYDYIGKNYSNDIWRNDQLNIALTTEPYKSKFDLFKSTWIEQRKFGINYALEALNKSTKFYENIMNELNYINNPPIPHINDTNKWKVIPVINNKIFTVLIDGQKFNVMFNEKTGSINLLKNMVTNINYLNITYLNKSSDGFGIFWYQTYTSNDFVKFWDEYSLVPDEDNGCNLEYCKNGMQKQAPFTDSQNIAYQSMINFYQNIQNEYIFLVEADLGNQQMYLYKNFGVPQKIYIKYDFSSTYNNSNETTGGDGVGFSIELIVENKMYTRLPETMWFAFKPNIAYNNVFVYKSGEYININNIEINGTFHLHAVDPNGCVENIFNSNQNKIQIYPLDAALSAFVPKTYHTFTDMVTPFINSTLQKGVSFALVNNFWGTNFPQWYPFDPNDSNQTYRFNVYLS